MSVLSEEDAPRRTEKTGQEGFNKVSTKMANEIRFNFQLIEFHLINLLLLQFAAALDHVTPLLPFYYDVIYLAVFLRTHSSFTDLSSYFWVLFFIEAFGLVLPSLTFRMVCSKIHHLILKYFTPLLPPNFLSLSFLHNNSPINILLT